MAYIRSKDPQLSQKDIIQGFQEIFDVDINEAQTYVTNLDNTLALNSEKMNAIIDVADLTQSFFYENIVNMLTVNAGIFQEFINNLGQPITEWKPNSRIYHQNEFVYYGDETYLCIQQTHLDSQITDARYWVGFNLKGKRGFDGLGINWKGSYIKDILYKQYDLVYIFKNQQIIFYVAKIENTPTADDLINSDNWQQVLLIDRHTILYTDTMPEKLAYPYAPLFLLKADDVKNVTYIQVEDGVAIPLNIASIIANVYLDMRRIDWAETERTDMTTGLKLLYDRYNLR